MIIGIISEANASREEQYFSVVALEFDCNIIKRVANNLRRLKCTFAKRDGNGEKAGLKNGVFDPAPQDFVLPHPRLLGPRKAPLHLVKLYFL